MPDKSNMKKYQKMLDEIASKYPELEEAVSDFDAALNGAMEPAGDDSGEAPDTTAEDEIEFPPPPPAAKRKGKDEEDDNSDEEDGGSYQF